MSDFAEHTAHSGPVLDVSNRIHPETDDLSRKLSPRLAPAATISWVRDDGTSGWAGGQGPGCGRQWGRCGTTLTTLLDRGNCPLLILLQKRTSTDAWCWTCPCRYRSPIESSPEHDDPWLRMRLRYVCTRELSQETSTGTWRASHGCAVDSNDKCLGFSRRDGICGKGQHSGFVPCMQLPTLGTITIASRRRRTFAGHNGTRPALIMP
ncbi:hypothetical protein CCMA1212_006888 [Trichoderma ghanense]|uniref:SSCRP protein n=1 Tax=Trichoderma ghanense TaxID=65468 RepID=A0ABY2H0C7_9HYPO